MPAPDKNEGTDEIPTNEAACHVPKVDTSDSEQQSAGINLLLLRRLRSLAPLLFPGICCLTSFLFVLLLLVCFLEQFVVYHVGLISSQYYLVLGQIDWPGFISTTLYSLGLVVVIAGVLSGKSYISNVLYISWRQVLSRALHRRYFAGINYYAISIAPHQGLDNPDQRMTQDVDLLCRTLGTMAATILVAPFKISYYTYQAYAGTGWLGPTIILLFFLVSSVINRFVMDPIVPCVVRAEKCEGDLRFKHMQIRAASESVAFHVSGSVEATKTNTALDELVRAKQRLFNKQFWLNLCQNLFDYLGSILSYLAIAVPIFSGVYDDEDKSSLSSIISKNAFVCIMLISSLGGLVDLCSGVVQVAGVTHRIAHLMEALDDLRHDWDHTNHKASASYTDLARGGGGEGEGGLPPHYCQQPPPYSPHHASTPLLHPPSSPRHPPASRRRCSLDAGASSPSAEGRGSEPGDGLLAPPPYCSSSGATTWRSSSLPSTQHQLPLSSGTTEELLILGDDSGSGPAQCAPTVCSQHPPYTLVSHTNTPAIASQGDAGDASSTPAGLPSFCGAAFPMGFMLQNVTLRVPGSSNTLVKDLNLNIRRGHNLLIMGPSSCGKTSLLRALRGLWPIQGGVLAYQSYRGPKAVMFLPQKPFLTNGTLREQIVYPEHLCDDYSEAGCDNVVVDTRDGGEPHPTSYRGDPEANVASPTANRASPTTNRSSPTTNRASPTANRSSRTANSSPTANRASPTANRSSPTNIRAIPQNDRYETSTLEPVAGNSDMITSSSEENAVGESAEDECGGTGSEGIGVPSGVDEQIELWLAHLRMSSLLRRCGGLDNDPGWVWSDVLSPGEVQRLCFLRVLYHRPHFAILDEATSALSSDVEATLYNLAQRANITVISVGHRTSLQQHHHTLLRLDGSGGWSMSALH